MMNPTKEHVTEKVLPEQEFEGSVGFTGSKARNGYYKHKDMEVGV